MGTVGGVGGILSVRGCLTMLKVPGRFCAFLVRRGLRGDHEGEVAKGELLGHRLVIWVRVFLK
ncbi:hypothetical protein BWD121_012320 [Bartonella sp. WD12.1]|nr:hypothetical protein BWD121_012320 [Bartonella sp. WD12.1]